jgi:DNA-binding response OmpR family regulator
MEVRQTREGNLWFMGSSLTLDSSEQETAKKEERTTQTPRRILVVDDSKDARESMATLLREFGYEVDTASDGSSAFAKALEFRPQVMLIDIVMPGGSGFKLAEEVRRDPRLRDTLLITLTGWDDNMDPWLSEHAGCDYHLTKPLDFTKLESCLEGGRKRRGEA